MHAQASATSTAVRIPSANSAEAVEIVTWHAAKGREWPITVVAEFDHGIAEWPGTTSHTVRRVWSRSDDMDSVLASAALDPHAGICRA